MTGCDAKPAALAHGEVNDAGVAAEYPDFKIDDIAGLGSAGLETLYHLCVAAGWHEADVLAVVLVGDRKAEAARQLPSLRLGLVAEGEAQHLKLLARGGKQEIALIALFLTGPVKRAAAPR